MDAAMEAELREMLDRQAVWQVLVRWARGVDRMDRDLARATYWDDAIEDHGQYVGDPDGFMVWVKEAMGQYLSSQHALTTHHCELDGDDAHCETTFIFTGVAAKPPHLMAVGRYIDHLQRRGGAWRFANRVTLVEGKFDLQDWQFSALMAPDYGPGDIYPGTRDRTDISYQRPVRPRRARR